MKDPSSMIRQRAEIIMKVRCGLMTATQAARKLGVSRKTYYKWEQRGLKALLSGLADKEPGRRSSAIDPGKKAMEEDLKQMHRENELLTHQMALKEVLNDLKIPGNVSRAKKK
jgi:transposase